MEKDQYDNYICPYNIECRCKTPECHKCGWNPEVTEERLAEIRDRLDNSESLVEQKYKIHFTGYCEVFAHSPEEAMEKADDGDMFFLHYNFGEPILDDKDDVNELD